MQEKTTAKSPVSIQGSGNVDSKNINDVELVKYLNQKYSELKKEVSKVIIGQENIIDQIIIAILSRGHCLLVGVPGLAKTLTH